MKKEQAYFVIFLFLMLILIILMDFTKPSTIGKINKINYYPDHITLNLENSTYLIYLTNNSPIKIKKDMQVEITGKKENYLNRTIIFADKIICKNC